jgi:hypothetical protein
VHQTALFEGGDGVDVARHQDGSGMEALQVGPVLGMVDKGDRGRQGALRCRTNLYLGS